MTYDDKNCIDCDNNMVEEEENVWQMFLILRLLQAGYASRTTDLISLVMFILVVNMWPK